MHSNDNDKMDIAVSSGRRKRKADLSEHKRRMIDNLEAVRGENRGEAVSHCEADTNVNQRAPRPVQQAAKACHDLDRLRDANASGKMIQIPENELKKLRRDLEVANATTSLLQEEIEKLEQKTISAISEAGQLRMRLEQVESNSVDVREEITQYLQERDALYRYLKDSETERNLLTQALGQSETEISRLAKNIDHLVRKLDVA